ncbi:hypothetical protein [Calothrix sp. PCC 6303]|uniref:hypothetical protein n=1 Tax=Calothrix sp. PCC 6303 TaxID=1170562 RepID=UPI0002A02AEA|nr:hypothetical protein [Calothrix sp. PCC 6303]AFZ00166.1 hypothetical protein Cal6303_1103 [Calothrix sp. PCC 6303]
MIFKLKENVDNPASILVKIRQFVSERTFLELAQDILKNGFPLLRRLVGLYFDKEFDKKYNVDTCGSIHLTKLTIKSKNREYGVIYDPLPLKTLRNILSSIPRVLSKYTLVDFGSGKGLLY